MDANSITLIIDNNQAWLSFAYEAAEDVMTTAGVLWGMPNDTEEPTRPLAALVGAEIKKMITDLAGSEYGMADQPAESLTSAIFFTTLGHIDWTEAGRHYYISAYERSREAPGRR